MDHNEPPIGDRTDQLLDALRRGEPQAFEELVRAETPRLLRVARRIMGSDQDAQDCVQDAFINAIKNLDGFEGRSSLATWLHRITVNACISRYRQRGRKAEESIDDLLTHFDAYGFHIGPSSSNDLSAEELLSQSETSDMVRSAIDQLPESYRMVLMLRDIEGYDTQEVADALEINPGAVKTRLHRARTALKNLLSPIFREDIA